jgi:hypothetical protein
MERGREHPDAGRLIGNAADNPQVQLHFSTARGRRAPDTLVPCIPGRARYDFRMNLAR